MAELPTTGHRYRLSFTSGSLLLREATIAVPIYLRERDWTSVRSALEAENLLQARTVASGHRRAREVVQRLSMLTDEEIDLLDDATADERAHLMWVAACRRYALVGEFAEEVLRERFLLLAPTLDHEDFDGFVRGKALWHEEIAELQDSTVRKLRSNIFRMLVEAGFVASDGRIVQAVLSTRVYDLLSSRTPCDLRFFPVRGDVR